MFYLLSQGSFNAAHHVPICRTRSQQLNLFTSNTAVYSTRCGWESVKDELRSLPVELYRVGCLITDIPRWSDAIYKTFWDVTWSHSLQFSGLKRRRWLGQILWILWPRRVFYTATCFTQQISPRQIQTTITRNPKTQHVFLYSPSSNLTHEKPWCWIIHGWGLISLKQL